MQTFWPPIIILNITFVKCKGLLKIVPTTRTWLGKCTYLEIVNHQFTSQVIDIQLLINGFFFYSSDNIKVFKQCSWYTVFFDSQEHVPSSQWVYIVLPNNVDWVIRAPTVLFKTCSFWSSISSCWISVLLWNNTFHGNHFGNRLLISAGVPFYVKKCSDRMAGTEEFESFFCGQPVSPPKVVPFHA